MKKLMSDTAAYAERTEKAGEFGRIRGEAAALTVHVVDLYLEVRAAAIAEGFSTTQAIVAATNAATTLKDRQEGIDRG